MASAARAGGGAAVYDRDRACDGKVAYFRLRRAHEKIRELVEGGLTDPSRGRLVAYACNKCPAWHIGHEPHWRLFDGEREIVEANLGIVADVLRRMRIPPKQWKDRFQDGVIGLAAAVRGCRKDRGSLNAYARAAVRNRVMDAREADRPIKVPRDQLAMLRGKAIPKFGGGKPRTATTFRGRAEAAIAPIESLDAPRPDGPRRLYAGGPSPADLAMTRDQAEHVVSVIEREDPKSARLIRLALAGYGRAEIAEMTCMSRTVVNATIARGYALARKRIAHDAGDDE